VAKQQLRIVHDADRGPRAPAPEGSPPLLLIADAALRAVLERGLAAIVGLTGAAGGAVRLSSDDGTELRLVAAQGLPARWVAEERSVSAGCGVCGLALQDDSLRLASEATSCRRRLGSFLCDGHGGSALALPLHCRGKAIGVFNLFFGPAPRGDTDLARLLRPMSDMLDIMIENAMLEQERLRASLAAERQLLAGEVHDCLAQELAFMRMRMSLLRGALEAGDTGRALECSADVSGTLGEAHGRLRELITQFRSGADPGLARALEAMARTFEARTGVALAVDNRVADLELSPEQEVQVYRIVQEALANVVKHAQARKARVAIQRREGRLTVSIDDDGRGLRAASPAEGGHYGLDIMRERAQRIGGELDIVSPPRGGTRVRLTLAAAAPAAD